MGLRKGSTMGKVEKSAKAERAEKAEAKAEKKQAARAVKAEKHFAMVDMEAEKQIAMVNMGSDRMPSTEMQETSVWDADDLAEIVSQIELERSLMVDFYKRKADIAEGCKHCCINFFCPWRWIDMQNNYNSIHLAVTAHHLLYIEVVVGALPLNVPTLLLLLRKLPPRELCTQNAQEHPVGEDHRCGGPGGRVQRAR